MADYITPPAFANNRTVAVDHLEGGTVKRHLQKWHYDQIASKHKIGTVKWKDSMISTTRRYEYPELDAIIGTVDKPIKPDHMSRQTRHWKKWKGDMALPNDAATRRESFGLTSRVKKVAEKLLKCRHEYCAWTTCVTSVAHDRQQALRQVANDGRRLESYIRRNFPNAIFVLVPEVDLMAIEDIADGLLPLPHWKRRYNAAALAYKVHFHGVIYVPGMRAEQIEAAITYTKNGKRSRFYSGSNQVRCLPLNVESGSDTPDIFGCMGYSEKRHFRPISPNHITENYAQWLWLTNEIEANPRLVITGGINGPLMVCCDLCGGHHADSDVCLSCEACVVDEGYREATDETNGYTDAQEVCFSEWFISNHSFSSISLSSVLVHSTLDKLNCLALTDWQITPKLAQKKLLEEMATLLLPKRKRWQHKTLAGVP